MEKIKWFFNEAKHHGFWSAVYYIFTKDTCDICEGFAPDSDLINVGSHDIDLICSDCTAFANAMSVDISRVEYNHEYDCYSVRFDD
jgi:hypothetical protein